MIDGQPLGGFQELPRSGRWGPRALTSARSRQRLGLPGPWPSACWAAWASQSREAGVVCGAHSTVTCPPCSLRVADGYSDQMPLSSLLAPSSGVPGRARGTLGRLPGGTCSVGDFWALNQPDAQAPHGLSPCQHHPTVMSFRFHFPGE